MALKSNIEIDFIRLLNKCQLMVNNSKYYDWRLDKYVEELENKLKVICKLNTCQPTTETLNIYKKKVNFLKGVVETETLSSPAEKLLAAQTLSPTSHNSYNNVNVDKTKEIHLQTQAKYVNQVRDELYNTKNKLRNRTNQSEGTLDDIDLVMKYHKDVQERIADDMVSLARNLKNNASVSNQIIKKDTETLERASVLAESNYSSLRQNSDKLTDFVKRSCQYWLWIMLAIVSFTFLWVVVFIRMFPKKH